jgi:hypothetical protein
MGPRRPGSQPALIGTCQFAPIIAHVAEQQYHQPAVPLRASNADREAVVRVLHDAAADGQLSVPEVEERLRLAYRAVTVVDLQPLTVDLAAHPQLGPAVSVPLVKGQPAGRARAIFSSIERGGQWAVPGHLEVVAVLGSVKLDLREAVFEHPHITITAYTFWGGVEVIVPDGVEVFVDGTGIVGAFENKTGVPARHYEGGGAQTPAALTRGSVRVTGFAVMAGVQARRANKRERRRAAQHK